MVRPSPDLIEHAAVPSGVRAQFRGYVWCNAIFEAQNLQPIATNYDMVEPGVTSSFLRKSLRSHDAIVSWQSFHKPGAPPSDAAETLPVDGELWVLYCVGPGADGSQGIAHGGFVTTLMDQAMGSWMKLHSQFGLPYTIYINVTFKAPLRTPSAVLCRAWIASVEGRKVKLNACLEGEKGGTIASAEALFITGSKL